MRSDRPSQLSIKRMLQISLAIMLLFVIAISMSYYLFAYSFSKRQFSKSFQTLSENMEIQLNAQFDGVEKSVSQLAYFSNMQEILFSKEPIVYLQNIAGCNQLLDYLKQASPLITEIMIDSPSGHSFYSGSTGKHRYRQLVESIREEAPDFKKAFFRTIPPENGAAQLPQLVYCFRVNNTQRRGYLSDECAVGVASIDVNQMIRLKNNRDYEGEVKAVLYRDDVVYATRGTTAEELAALNDASRSSFFLNNAEYTRHAVAMQDLGLTMVDLIPNAALLQDSIVVRNIGVAMLLATCILLILSSWFIMHKISTPVKQMVADMRKIREGGKDRIDPPHLTDLRYVAEGFNETLGYLEDSNRRQQEMSLNLYRSTLAQKQAQLNSYKNQINPHFLFNTLESMRSMARHYGVPVLEKMLTSLAVLFRYSLRSDLVVPLKEELRHVRHYFNVMDMRAPQRYELRIRMDPAAAQYPTLSMILQPLAENSISHGFQQKKEPCIILIQGSLQEDGRLRLVIADNGAGIPAEKLGQLRSRARLEHDVMHNEHIGVENVLHRLRLFYGDRFDYSLDSREGFYTAVRLVIPKYPL